MDTRAVVSTAPKRLNFNANTSIPGNGTLVGLVVSTATSGTLTLADAAGNIVVAMPVTAGQYVALPCVFQGGLTITVGGTLNATIFYGD